MAQSLPHNDNNGSPKNVGDRIRKLLKESTESTRCKKTYLDTLNTLFGVLNKKIKNDAVEGYKNIFNECSRVHKEGRDLFLTSKLTTPEGQGGYSPITRTALPFVTTITDISPRDLFQCPHYIQLHETAREMNVAIALNNIFTEDTQNNPYGNPPVLVIDARMTYEEGARKDPNIYPDLPPIQEDKSKYDPRTGGKFKL